MLTLLMPVCVIGLLVGLLFAPMFVHADELPYRSPRARVRALVARRIARREAEREAAADKSEPETTLPEVPAAAVYRRRAVEARLAAAAAAEAARVREEEAREERVRELLSRRLTRAEMLRVVRAIETAADSGKTEAVIARFPVALTTDRGRAINNAEFGPEVAATLRGLPAELHAHFASLSGYRFRAFISRFAEDGTPEEAVLILRFAY